MISFSELRTKHALFCTALTLVAVIGAARPATAQDWDSVVIRGGALLADIGSSMSVDASVGNGAGTEIDLEDDLGFDANATTYFIEGVWRLSKRNQLQVGYVNINRDVRHARPSRTFTFRDTTYTINSDLDAFFDSWYLTMNYGYAFIANPKAELGVNIGVTAMKFNTGIGIALEGGNNEVNRDLDENAEFTAPIPLPGLFTNLRPHPRVALNGSLRIIKASIDKLDGLSWEAKFGGDVTLVKGLAIGAAYYFNDSELDRHGRLWNGSVDYSFGGPQIYGALSF